MEQTVRLLIACTVLLIVVARISYCCVVHYKDIFGSTPITEGDE